MVRIFLLLILSMISHHLWSQMIPEDSIRHHARRLITERSLDKRTESFDYLNRNVGDWLMQNGVPEQEVEGMAIIEEPSTGLRVISYELYRDTSTYDYGGWIHLEGWDKPVFLEDHSRDLEDDEDLDFMTLAPDYWYGMLYYQVVPLTISDDKSIYLLFGLDNYHLFTKRKVMEVLVIEGDDIRFGAPVIEMDPDLPREYRQNRFILDYSVQAPAALRYDTDHDKIIFDHLMYMRSDYKEQKVMKVPDGTYSGFEIIPEMEKVVFVEKVFHQVMDEAPGGREKPKEPLNIIGEPMNKDKPKKRRK